ncbi:Exopolyphosphatase [Entomophthora muscae]|uniref:Exopolyphosphatase n=1 Tax=Entomophthora muscae TaxID=34485 RepID=A0ACC2TPW1_9FUNG|nr:Exopolyphosphatase [Entomophthora muscae]
MYLKSASIFERLLKQGRDQLQKVLKASKLPLAGATLPDKAPLSLTKEIYWVMGNEAADLDSIVSSVSFAILKAHLNDSHSLTLPLINLPRDDINLRPEVLYVFEQCQLPHELLLFIDDPLVLEWEELTAKAGFKSNFILVDHNQLHSRFSDWNGVVKAIYDHHVDEAAHPNANPRVIRPVGSNTSLVVEWWKKQHVDPHQDILPDLALFMLAPILIDTVNLKGEYGRVTDLDVEVAGILRSLIISASFKGDDMYFKSIDDAKVSVSHMTPNQLLRRDFKLWTTPISNRRLGIASIVNWALRDWVDFHSQSPESNMIKFASLHNLDLLVVMGSKQYPSKDPCFRRDLYFYTPDHIVSDHLAKELPQMSELGLIPTSISTQPGFAFYDQSVVSASRKVTFPIFRDLLDEIPASKPQ